MTTASDSRTSIRVRRLHDDAVIPVRAREGDAGLDLVSVERLSLAPGERALVATGIAVAIPHGYAGLVCPRSGLAVRHGIGVVNGPGVIDAGYRGEVKVVLINHDPTATFDIAEGDRIAQLVVTPIATSAVVEVDDLDSTDRGDGGFGSTGRA